MIRQGDFVHFGIFPEVLFTMRVLRNIFIMAVILSAAVCCGAAAKDAEENAAEVGLFDAMDKGLVEVKMTQNGALEGNLSVKNVSDQPLKIDMPAAFAGVPVAQFGPMGPGMGGPGMGGPGMGMGGPGMGMGGGPGMMPGMGGPGGRNGGPMGRMGAMGDRGRMAGGRNGGMSGGNQSVGGGSRGGGGRGGRGGGWFIAPEKTVREKVRTVCLEHGKNDPRGGQEYAVVPFESVSGNKTTQALCEMLGDDSIDQQSLQAAVWNQECEVSIDELSEKVYQPAGNVTPRPWFSKEQMAESLELIKAAEVRAEEISAEEKAEQKAADVAAENEALAADSYNGKAPEVDNTIEKLTEDLK